MKIVNVLFLVLVLAVGCQTSQQNDTQDNKEAVATEAVKVISEKPGPEEFFAKYKASPGANLLDIRTPEEVAGGQIPEAKNLDFHAEYFQESLEKLDKEKPIFIYCASGGRSGKAANMLEKMGFTEIYDLKGGFGSWESAGLEIAGRPSTGE